MPHKDIDSFCWFFQTYIAIWNSVRRILNPGAIGIQREGWMSRVFILIMQLLIVPVFDVIQLVPFVIFKVDF